MIGLWLAVALASPATDALERAAGASGVGPTSLSGTLAYAGHGRRPGEVSEHRFSAAVAADPALGGRWVASDWHDALHIGTPVLRDEGAGWTEPIAADSAWLTVQFLAPNPGLLMAQLAREPARVQAVDGAVLWASAAGLATVHFAADGRPISLELPRSHPVFGDVVDGVRWTWTEAGPTTVIRRAEADTRWTATLEPGATAPAEVPPPTPTVRGRTELAPGVFAIDVPEANSRALLVVDGTRGVLFDAPLTSAIGADLLAVARALGPDVRDWSVVVSHHHPHYVGGLRPWARAGATIYAPAGIASWLEEDLRRPRDLDPGDPAVSDAVVVGVRGGLELGAVELRAIDGDSGHTDAFLLAFLTGPRLLYVADLASWKLGADAPRIRGEWAGKLRRWQPEHVVSAFPLEGTRDSWPWAGD